jgi:hypothetical protein
LVALAPDVIITVGIPALAAMKQVTGTVPIVFVNIVDPVGAGFVESLARPAGNVTGFTSFEYGNASGGVDHYPTGRDLVILGPPLAVKLRERR